jgi:hypothetical protein
MTPSDSRLLDPLATLFRPANFLAGHRLVSFRPTHCLLPYAGMEGTVPDFSRALEMNPSKNVIVRCAHPGWRTT